MPKKDMPPPKHARKRLTENASASRIAEADEIWHSTAIDDSRLNFDLSGAPSPPQGPSSSKSNNNKGRQGQLSALREATERGPGSSASNGQGQRSKTPSEPIIITAPSGHSFISSVLQKCGYIIRQPATNNEMFVEVMKFRKQLADWLVENEDEMSRVETNASKFLKALNAYLTENLKLAMKPTKHKTELIQPSLLHCLLGIESIQPQVIKIIMPLLGECALSTTEEQQQMVETIIAQLKWIPTIVEGEKFTRELLTIVDNSGIISQSHIIKELPNILPADLHPKIARKLLEKFSDEGMQLNVPLMECFSSLEIPESDWTAIRNTAIDQMANAPLSDIPAYFSFVFRVESLSALNDIISTIREKVQLVPEDKSQRNHAYQVEILERFTLSISIKPEIMTIWVKQIKEDLQNGLADNIKKIDMLMMLLFADSNKAAINILKSLLAETKLAIDLFSQLMKENVAMVYHLFSTISRILDSLLRSRDNKCSEAVCDLTVKLFLGLTMVEAQTLMGNLTSILINFSPARDAVLKILTKIAEMNAKNLTVFAPHLMGVLEYVMQFPARQIRAIMKILATLSQTEPKQTGGTNHFKTEFSILLRKQLTHSDIKIRCFGVFGALATVQQMALQSENNPDVNERMAELLKLTWDHVERDEEACGIFFDELSECAEALPDDICNTYRMILLTKFQDLWTMEPIDKDKIQQYCQRSSLNLCMFFDANKECTEGSMLLTFENKYLEMSPLVIPAHFRALAVLESKVTGGELTGIDALLGSPLLFPSMEEYFKADDLSMFSYNQRRQLGQYLILAINYFRESVSAFVTSSDAELRVKIWSRLIDILTLQKILQNHYESFPSLPNAYVADKTIGSSRGDGAGPSGLQALRQMREGMGHLKPQQAKSSGKKTSAKKGSKKSAKKKPRREVTDSGAEEEEDADDDAPVIVAKKFPKVSLDEEIQPKRIFPHLRRLDQSVFRMLMYPLQCVEERHVNFSEILADLSAISQDPNRIAKVEKFTPQILCLLLVELKHQLTDEKLQLDIFSVKNLLKNICRHIETISAVLLKNEENEDSLAPDLLNNLECCLRLLIVIMTSYFEAIRKLSKEDRETKIERVVRTLARFCQVSEEEEETASQEKRMATYLKDLVSYVKDPATALDHLKSMKTLHDLLEDKSEIQLAIQETAENYLRNDWKLPAAQVDGFLKVWFGTRPDPFKLIRHLTKELITLPESEDNSESERIKLPNRAVYKSCLDSNFHVWYNAIFSALSQYVHKNLRRRGDFDRSINDWSRAMKVFSELIFVTKKTQKTLILSSLLKNCRMFLEAFISGGIELIPRFWQDNSDEAQTFLKSIQLPCRTIQHICEHAKKKTDMQLLKSVPIVKRVLETFIFRVREVLAVNGAAKAYWLGSLMHRDIRGQRIQSQQVIEDSILLMSSDEEDSDLAAAPLSHADEDEAMDVDEEAEAVEEDDEMFDD